MLTYSYLNIKEQSLASLEVKYYHTVHIIHLKYIYFYKLTCEKKLSQCLKIIHGVIFLERVKTKFCSLSSTLRLKIKTTLLLEEIFR